ncbi:hypothetical protein [Neobacillus cucumis]|uniref:hypothetical protein n=1 Tax=Neobacillus cucumis TaxID=1740721 RepID=UPI00285339A4|nr:hypothetical protein [Neobacillus cucumis]MDR4949805.1 hypothetical protein [Neobacillus cucumis]
MNILISVLFIILVLGTSGLHMYFIWKKKEYKTLFAQLGILGLAIVGGVLTIYNFPNLFSISKLLNLLSPL